MGSLRKRWLNRRALLSAVLLSAAVTATLLWLRPAWFLELEFMRQRWVADAVEREVVLTDHRWRYLQSGSEAAGAPLILLVHGYTGAKENWLPLLPHLDPGYRVIVPDLPGWGESQRNADGDYGYPAQAARLAQFIEWLDGDLYLVGHSMGGGIAALAAADNPQRVHRLALVDAAGVRFRDNRFGQAVLAGENPFAVETRAELHRWLNIVFKHPPPLPWPIDRALLEQRQQNRQFEDQVMAQIGRGSEAFLPGEAASRIQVPTELIWCREDQVIDPSAAEIYAERIPTSRITLLGDCGHMPMMEQPAALAEALLRAPAVPVAPRDSPVRE